MVASRTTSAPIDYTVAVDTRGSSPSLNVTIAFEGDRDGSTEIDLPSQWAGSEGLDKNLSDLVVTGGTLVTGTDAARPTIQHAPGARLTLRYRVLDAQPGAPAARTFEKARPVVEPDWFYVHTEGAFAIPTGREMSPARFRWRSVPKGWRVASDLDLADPAKLTANAAASAILIGGKRLHITERSTAGRTLRLATLGEWRFSDDQLAGRLTSLIATENAMLSAPAMPYFVSLAPLAGSDTGSVSYGGSGRTAGFALTSTDNVPIGDLTRLLAHEYAHRWFGRDWGPNADGAADYWFTEGFADWFASLAMVRSGLWTATDWRESINMLLLRYAASTARGLSDTELTTQFWTNRDAMQVQYDRGNLAATLLDNSLRERGSSLLAILHRMDDARKLPPESEVARLSRLASATLVLKARGGAAAKPLPATIFGACGTLAEANQPAYDRGFTLSDNMIVDAVHRGSPAWRAGVRPGFRYVRRLSNGQADASKPYEAEFLDGDIVRRLSWLPEGAHRVDFQRLQADRNDCISYLRGASTGR